MKVTALVAALAFMRLASPELVAQQAPAAVVQEIQSVENDWAKAYQTKDVNIFSRILAQEWYGFSTEDGKRSSVQDEIQGTKADKATYSSIINTVREVRLYGDIAVALGENVSKGSDNGKPFERHYSWQTIFVKRGGHWLAVASHDSPVPLPRK